MERRSALAAAAAALLLVTVAAWAAAARQNAAEATLGFLRTWTGVALPAAGAAPPPLLAQLPLNASAARQRLDTTPNSRPPIAFIPPLGGVQLQTRLSGAAARHFWCPRSTGGAWRLSWLNLATLLPGLFPCWADNFRSLRLGSACRPTNQPLTGGCGRPSPPPHPTKQSCFLACRLECDAGGRCGSPPGVEVEPVPGFDSAMGVVPGAPGQQGRCRQQSGRGSGSSCAPAPAGCEGLSCLPSRRSAPCCPQGAPCCSPSCQLLCPLPPGLPLQPATLPHSARWRMRWRSWAGGGGGT